MSIMAADVVGYQPSELSRSEEEESLLKKIREEKEQLWFDIQDLRRQIIDIDNDLAALDEANDEEIRQAKEKQRVIRTGRNKFNTSPKEGIKYLQSQNELGESSDEIAQWLFKGELLSKRAIGDYLGEGKDFNIEVLRKFIALHDFTGKILVDAIRAFLGSFHLPGEAQKIDRIMEIFAQRYIQCNPDGLVTNQDTVYVLAFSIIMLHTSLHNPSVKDKPTIERFISMNRGIDNGKDLPTELLTEFYENVKKEEFKVPDGEGSGLAETFFNPEKQGWLTKEGGKYKSKHRRWFILKENMLYYFKQPTDSELIGSIPLDPDLRVREVEDPKAPPHCFEIYSDTGVIKAWKKDSDGKVVKGNHDVYRLQAGSVEERDEWIKCIDVNLRHGSVYDNMTQRRRKITGIQGLDIPEIS